MSKILVINSGSSSLKFTLFKREGLTLWAKGLIEEIGSERAKIKVKSKEGETIFEDKRAIRDHSEALFLMTDCLTSCSILKKSEEILAVGHRVVHGGEKFRDATLITKDVLNEIKRLFDLAPLHNPSNLLGIEVAIKALPGIPQVAVFDTAFHQTMPERAWHYAIPLKFYQKNRIRRYGFHGTSHSYVNKKAADFLEKNFSSLSSISLHLGNGASACAIKNGKCIDTSMGFTPLEGLVMGTRSGDIDPSIVIYLIKDLGFSLQEVEDILNKKSGLFGLCGESDMRKIVAGVKEGDRDKELALDIFCYRIKKYISSYLAVTGKIDCLIFTGGIGENSSLVRERICSGLEHLGIVLDERLNGISPNDDVSRIGKEDGAVLL